MSVHTEQSPLERLQLREALQDRWRDQVRAITELSVTLHSMLEREGDGDIDVVATAISGARLRLAETEDAMRRLDERSYGRCDGCLMPIPFPILIDEPDARFCGDCRRAGAATPDNATADSDRRLRA